MKPASINTLLWNNDKHTKTRRNVLQCTRSFSFQLTHLQHRSKTQCKKKASIVLTCKEKKKFIGLCSESLCKQRGTVTQMQKKLIILKKMLGKKDHPDVPIYCQYSVVNREQHEDQCAFGMWYTGTTTAESRKFGNIANPFGIHIGWRKHHEGLKCSSNALSVNTALKVISLLKTKIFHTFSFFFLQNFPIYWVVAEGFHSVLDALFLQPDPKALARDTN